jgi:4-diphosphocytidyl-2-C-methyl-D-erythritol kinase
MRAKAYAKINLALDVLGKDKKTGYHKIRTVFYEYKNLYDEIEIKSAKKDKVEGWYKGKKISILKKDDIVFKTIELIKRTKRIKNKYVNVKVLKKTPWGSGLAGGSSDAAAVLKGLNKLWNLKLSKKDLIKIGGKIGKDVPFFILGGIALGENFGEKLTPLPQVKLNIKLLPKKSPRKTKTKYMYQRIDLKKCGKESEKTKKLLMGIKTGNKKMIIENLHNDFETIPANKPKKGWHLCGAGPSVFKAIV